MIKLAEIGADNRVLSIVEVESYLHSFALRRSHRDISNMTPEPGIGWFWDGKSFDPDPPKVAVVDLIPHYISTMTEACRIVLLAGFSSDALGSLHTYPSAEIDQRNLTAAMAGTIAAADGWMTVLWCRSDGAWLLADHTAAQVKIVMDSWLAYRTAQQRKLAALLAEIRAAPTQKALAEIIW